MGIVEEETDRATRDVGGERNDFTSSDKPGQGHIEERPACDDEKHLPGRAVEAENRDSQDAVQGENGGISQPAAVGLSEDAGCARRSSKGRLTACVLLIGTISLFDTRKWRLRPCF